MDYQTFFVLASAVGTGVGYAVWRAWRKPPEATSGTPMIGEEPAYLFTECPDCGGPIERFLAGPSGGMSQNVLCNTCHHEYNIANLGGHLVMIDDLGIADEGRLRVYGVTGDE